MVVRVLPWKKAQKPVRMSLKVGGRIETRTSCTRFDRNEAMHMLLSICIGEPKTLLIDRRTDGIIT